MKDSLFQVSHVLWQNRKEVKQDKKITDKALRTKFASLLNAVARLGWGHRGRSAGLEAMLVLALRWLVGTARSPGDQSV